MNPYTLYTLFSFFYMSSIFKDYVTSRPTLGIGSGRQLLTYPLIVQITAALITLM